MRADAQLRSAAATAASALRRVRAGCEPVSRRHRDAERREPARQRARVLLRQQFGRRHQSHLRAAADARGAAAAAATTVLPQPTSPCTSRAIGVAQRQVGRSISSQHAPLRAGERKRQDLQQPWLQLRSRRAAAARVSAGEPRRSSHQRQLVRQQLLEAPAAAAPGVAPAASVASSVPTGGRCTNSSASRSVGRLQLGRSRLSGRQLRRGPSARARAARDRTSSCAAVPASGPRSPDRSASASATGASPSAAMRRYSGCTISSPSGPRRTSP